MDRSDLYIIVAGCGRLGARLASELSRTGSSVVVIDRDPSRFAALTAEFSGFHLTGDAIEQEVLRSAKIEQADCFLATTNQDNINLMLAQVAKVIYGVPLVMARIYDPLRSPVYERLGIDTISPTELSAQEFLCADPGAGGLEASALRNGRCMPCAILVSEQDAHYWPGSLRQKATTSPSSTVIPTNVRRWRAGSRNPWWCWATAAIRPCWKMPARARRMCWWR